MAQLFLEGRRVRDGKFGPIGHLYLVYRDDDGTEKVFSGGPGDSAWRLFGDILVEDGVPIKQSQDMREDDSPARRGQILLMSGDQAREALPKIEKSIRAIKEVGVGYDLLGPNSNTTIAFLLHSIGYFPDELPELRELDGTKTKLTYPGFCDATEIREAVNSSDFPTEWLEDKEGKLCPRKLKVWWKSLRRWLLTGGWEDNMADSQQQKSSTQEKYRLDSKFLGSGHDDHSGLLPGGGGLEGTASGVSASDIPPAPVSWETSGWDEEDSTRFYKNIEEWKKRITELEKQLPRRLYPDTVEKRGSAALRRLDRPGDTGTTGFGARATLYADYATPSGSARPTGAVPSGVGSFPDMGPLLDIGPPPYSQGVDPVRPFSRLRGPYFRLRPQDMGRQPRPSGPSTETVPVTRYQASETVPDLPYFPDNPLLQEMIYISPKGMAWRRALQAEAASVATPPVDPDPTRYRGDRRRQFKPLLDLTPWLPQTD